MEKAIEFWRQAGQRALERSANVEAIGHLGRAIKLIQALSETADRQRLELGLQTMLAGPMISTKGYGGVETGAVFDRAQALSEKVNDPTLLFPVLYQQWVFNIIGSRVEAAHERAQNFIELAENQTRVGPKILGQRVNAVSLFYKGQLEAAKKGFEAALSLYDPAEHIDLKYRYGQDPAAASLAFLTTIDHLTGDPERALERSAEALERATHAKHANTLAYTLHYGPVSAAILRRDIAAAEALSNQMLQLAEEQGLAMWAGYASVCSAWVLAQRGNSSDAIELAERGVAGLAATRTELDRPKVACHLAEIYQADRRHEDAMGVLDDAIDFAHRTKDRWYLAEAHRLRGCQLLALGAEGASHAFQTAIDVAQSHSARCWEVRAMTDLARLLVERGERGR